MKMLSKMVSSCASMFSFYRLINWIWFFFSDTNKRLMNKLQPNAITKFTVGRGGFKSRENISLFRKKKIFCYKSWQIYSYEIENAARDYGLLDADLFQAVDLYEKRNIAQVTSCIFALGRQVSNAVLFNQKFVHSFFFSFRHKSRTSMGLYSVPKRPNLIHLRSLKNNFSPEKAWLAFSTNRW